MSEELERFIEITKVPRCSGFNDLIGGFVIDFAEKNGLSYVRDGLGNIVIDHPGPTERIILQAHQDMVAAVSEGSDFDFRSSPLRTYIDGDWIRADGTTLGADDGSGIALCLCALKEPKLKDISLRCIFTVDEETGLSGALGLRKEWLDGRYLINIDSECDEELTIGCAANLNILSEIVPEKESVRMKGFRLSISGLRGGHSAGCIDMGRANALMLALEFVSGIGEARISSFEGGSFFNSIPSSASISFSVPDGTDVQRRLDDFRKNVGARYSEDDPDVGIRLEECDIDSLWTAAFSRDFSNALLRLPNGVFEKDGLNIITSSNTGFIRSENDVLTVANMPRSSDAGSLEQMKNRILSIMDSIGARSQIVASGHPWSESAGTKLISKAVALYGHTFGKEPRIVITHGGLECGVFKSKNPCLQQISIGPTILNAHSVDERMSISSFAKMKDYLYLLIEELVK